MRELSNKQSGRRNKILIIILAAVAAAAVGVSIWALFLREPAAETLAPDYAPQETEKNAEPIEGDDGRDKLEAQAGGGAVSLSYAKTVSIDLSDKKASLYFANPSESTEDMLVQLVIDETVVVQSGRLTPGNQVTALDLSNGTDSLLSEGGYDGKLVVLFYNQTTSEKAMINTEIPVTITVTE